MPFSHNGWCPGATNSERTKRARKFDKHCASVEWVRKEALCGTSVQKPGVCKSESAFVHFWTRASTESSLHSWMHVTQHSFRQLYIEKLRSIPLCIVMLRGSLWLHWTNHGCLTDRCWHLERNQDETLVHLKLPPHAPVYHLTL